MKYSDINKLYSSYPMYKADYTLNSVPGIINSFINERGLILDPIFQRGQVWKEEQKSKYIEFLLMGGTTAQIYIIKSVI